ncbi:MAG: hypothetical protein AAB389_02145 [Patescibacteria group bacterium]
MSRLVKQLVYGFFYLVILAGIAYLGYLAIRETAPSCFDGRLNQKEEETDCGGPCESCAIRHLLPLQAKVEYFGVGENTTAILTLSNPNLEYGADSFSYTLSFPGNGGTKIFTLTKESFIYPAEAQKVIIEPNLKFNNRSVVGQPELAISNIVWKPIREFSEPQIQTRQVKTEVNGAQVIVSGLLVNRESLSFSRAGVGVLVFQQLSDESSRLVGASKTILQNLQPFEERSFKIIIPLGTTFKLSEIDTLITYEVR